MKKYCYKEYNKKIHFIHFAYANMQMHLNQCPLNKFTYFKIIFYYFFYKNVLYCMKLIVLSLWIQIYMTYSINCLLFYNNNITKGLQIQFLNWIFNIYNFLNKNYNEYYYFNLIFKFIVYKTKLCKRDYLVKKFNL